MDNLSDVDSARNRKSMLSPSQLLINADSNMFEERGYI